MFENKIIQKPFLDGQKDEQLGTKNGRVYDLFSMGECLTLYGTKIDDKGEPFIGSMSLYDDPSSSFIGSSSPYDNGDFDKKITNRLVTNLGFGAAGNRSNVASY